MTVKGQGEFVGGKLQIQPRDYRDGEEIVFDSYWYLDPIEGASLVYHEAAVGARHAGDLLKLTETTHFGFMRLNKGPVVVEPLTVTLPDGRVTDTLHNEEISKAGLRRKVPFVPGSVYSERIFWEATLTEAPLDPSPTRRK